MTQAPTPEIKTNVKQGAIIGGWLCFILGLIVMYISMWVFFIYGPLLIAALILSIVGMAQRRIVTGMVLLLVTLIVPPVLGFALAAQRTGKALEKANQSIRESLPPGLQQALPPATPGAAPERPAVPPALGVPPFRWVAPADFYTSPASQIGVWKAFPVDKAGDLASLSFSPDGSKFAYVRPKNSATRGEAKELVICDLASREVKSTHDLNVSNNEYALTGWSPDANRIIVFLEAQGARMVDLVTRQVITLRDLKVTPNLEARGVEMTPSFYSVARVVWPEPNKVWLIVIREGWRNEAEGRGYVDGCEVDLDKLTTQTFRQWPGNPAGKIAHEREVAKWRDMVYKKLKQGQYRIYTDTNNNIMVSDIAGGYAKYIGNGSRVLLAPDSSCVLVNGRDEGFIAIYLGVSPSHTQYTISFSKQGVAAALITKIKALAPAMNQVFVKVYKRRINPLNQKIVGVEDNSYAGDARVVQVDANYMRVVVTKDLGIAPGLVAAGAYYKEGADLREDVSTEEVWGVLEVEDQKLFEAAQAAAKVRTEMDEQLLQAAKDGNAQAAQTSLSGGADVNAKSRNGDAGLLIAAENGHTAIVKLLLERGADVNAKKTNGVTPLLRASQNGFTEVVKLLVEGGADVDAKTTNGITALHMASQNGHTDVAKLLLAKGPDVNAKTTEGVTALFIATQQGCTDIVKLLLDAKADINVKVTINWTEYTPLSKAQEQGHTQIIQLLKEAGAKK